MNGGRLDVIDELYAPEMAAGARRWIAPFRESFPDVQMEIVELIAEGQKVVGRFRCSGTNLGPWRGKPPTGRRFERVDAGALAPREADAIEVSYVDVYSRGPRREESRCS